MPYGDARGPGVGRLTVRLISADEFIELEAAKMDWVIHTLIARPSKVTLIGAPKEGKTFLAAGLADSVARGGEFLGHHCETGRVLYLQLDTPAPVWKDTLRKLRDSGNGVHPGVLFVHPNDQKRPLNVLTPDTRQYLREALHAAKPDLVILDTLRKIHSADENDSTEMKIVFDQIDDVFGTHALLILHHTRKLPADATEPDPAQTGRGSSYITGDVDGIWLLHGGRLRTTSRFDERNVYGLVREENGLWSSPDDTRKRQLTEQVVGLCTEHPDMPHAKLAPLAKARWGMSRATYYRLMAGRLCAHSAPPVAT